MQFGLIISVLLHAALLGGALLSIHSRSRAELRLPVNEPVAVGMITPSDVTKVKLGTRTAKLLEAEARDSPDGQEARKEVANPKLASAAPPAASAPPPPAPIEEKVEPPKADPPASPPKAADPQPPAPVPGAEALKKLDAQRKLEAEQKKAAEQQKLAEEQRQAAEKKRVEDQQLAEAERLAAEKKAADEKKLAEEQQRQAEERKRAEEQRLEAEKKQAEERRLAEEKRQAEEQRLAEEKRRAEEQKRLEEQRKQAELKKKRDAEKKKQAELRKKRELAEKKRQEEEKKRQEVEAKSKFSSDKIAALLNKIPDEAPPPPSAEGDEPTKAKGPTLGDSHGRDKKISGSERALLIATISTAFRKCWELPSGGGGSDTPLVKLRWRLHPDGSLDGEPQVLEPRGDALFRLAAESALRAVRKCAPFDLPPELYDAWRVINWNFDPSKML